MSIVAWRVGLWSAAFSGCLGDILNLLGQISSRPHTTEKSLNGGLVREILLFQGHLGRFKFFESLNPAE